MDIEIKITPRLIERTIFIILIIGLVISNVYFYNKSSVEVIAEDESLAAAGENKTTTTTPKAGATTTTIKNDTTTTTTIIESAENATSTSKYGKATPDKPDGTCAAGWRCFKPYYKGFVLANCNWSNVLNCVNGCENGACKS